MSTTQPTEAHRKLAKEVIGAYKFAVDGYAAQLIADSEARAVAQLRSELNYAKASETLYHDEGTAAIAAITAERERVRVLREALEKYQHTVIAGGTNPARDALTATEDSP
jgi:hypothetical protein